MFQGKQIQKKKDSTNKNTINSLSKKHADQALWTIKGFY